MHLLVGALLLDEVGEKTSHETCADILERSCRSVIDLKTIDPVGYLDKRNVELQGVIYDVLEVGFWDVFAKEALGNLEGNLLKREILDVVEE